MIKILKSLLLLLFITAGSAAFAQSLPFAADIQAFKKQDSIHFPAKNAILFVGSSSFTMWKDVQDYFPGYPIINRGFGGSSLTDVIRYADDIIFPYQAKQIVIYCGENDLAGSDTVTGKTVFNRFKQLFGLIRKRMPNVSVAYISAKPSPSRLHLLDKMQEANRLIEGFLKQQKNTAFIDVYHLMLTPQGNPMPDIFRDDKLHMNAKGYAIWQKAIQPYLVK